MPLNSYTENALLCNVSVNGETSTPGTFAFRGDMVIEEGDIADAQGRRNPPKSVLKQAVVLASTDKLSAVVGAVSDIGYLPDFVKKYGPDFGPEIKTVFYVNNISKPMICAIEDCKCILIPYEDGAVWTMLMEDVHLEKSDFKGQSAADKVVTIIEGLDDFTPKYEEKPYNDALSFTIEVRKEARGPV